MSGLDLVQIRRVLLDSCVEMGLFEASAAPAIWTKDLIDTGAIDSMGLVTLAGILEENFEIEVPHEIMVAEIRTLGKLAEHVFKATRG